MYVKDPRRPDHGPSPNGFVAILKFNLKLTEDITIYDMTLVRSPAGKLMLYPPSAGRNAPALSVSPELRAEIINLAKDALTNDYSIVACCRFHRH